MKRWYQDSTGRRRDSRSSYLRGVADRKITERFLVVVSVPLTVVVPVDEGDDVPVWDADDVAVDVTVVFEQDEYEPS